MMNVPSLKVFLPSQLALCALRSVDRRARHVRSSPNTAGGGGRGCIICLYTPWWRLRALASMPMPM